MTKNANINRNDLLAKNNHLSRVKETLKNEFSGLDSIIEQLVDSCSSWYLLSEFQERPTVINLWGLTGVGKTSLIKRFVELINYQDSFYRFDMGQKTGFNSFYKSLSELCNSQDTKPVVILFDEFQHAKTIRPYPPFEEENDETRTIWEILDSGKITYVDWKRGTMTVEEEISVLNSLIDRGVVVKNGKVVEKIEVFKNIIGNGVVYENDIDVNIDNNDTSNLSPNERDYLNYGNPFFISENLAYALKNTAMSKYSFRTRHDVFDYTSKMNEREILEFAEQVLRESYSPIVKDMSNALIFVAGNLDEAFNIADDFTVDIDADEFHKQTLKVTILEIKEALKRRFRNEQIARLGNNHIIYPALSSKSYRNIIEGEINKLTKKFEETLGISFEVDKSLIDIIYKEGVVPTQGTRPTFTTINSLFTSKLNNFIAGVFLMEQKPSYLKIYIKDKKLYCDYFLENKLLSSLNEDLVLNLDELRRSKKDELQAITAVHESGHIVVMSILEGKVPEVAFSRAACSSSSGFVFSVNQRRFKSKRDVLNEISSMLGGLIAEKLIFGEENSTIGSSSDLENLTHDVLRLLKNNGYSEVPLYYATTSDEHAHYVHDIKSIEIQAKELVMSAMKTTEELLIKERILLLELSIYLSENTFIKKNIIEEFISKFAVSKPKKPNASFYRDKLMSDYSNLKALSLFEGNQATVLNKKA